MTVERESMTVSVVVATLDRPGDIERFFASVVGQTRLPDELVVVDAGRHADEVTGAEGHTDPLIVLGSINPPTKNIALIRRLALKLACRRNHTKGITQNIIKISAIDHRLNHT